MLLFIHSFHESWVVVLLNLLQLLHFYSILHHTEKILAEIQEDQRCSFNQLNVDHVVSRKFADFAFFERVSLLQGNSLAISLGGDMTP